MMTAIEPDYSAQYRETHPNDWMGTYTGKKLFIFDIHDEDINLADIAHALSLKCRFQGHCIRFYSVAEHSILASRLVAPEFRRSALMHDTPEAYLPDVPAPCKPLLSGFKDIEHTVEAAIWHRFGLDHPGNHPKIKEVDRRLVVTERNQNMKEQPPWLTHVGVEPYHEVRIECLAPWAAEQRFLARANELGIS